MFLTENLSFAYPDGASFQYPDIHLNDGENLLIVGPSGSGKTTLLNLLAGLQVPKSGRIFLNQTNYTALSGTDLDSYRSEHIGIVLQESIFVPSISVWQNLLLTQKFTNNSDETKADKLLHRLQIAEKKNQAPYSLSIGEQQRLSIARSLVNTPSLLLADEPTSALDDENCDRVLGLLKSLASENNCHLIIITHDQRVKDAFSITLNLGSDE